MCNKNKRKSKIDVRKLVCLIMVGLMILSTFAGVLMNILQ